MRLTWPFLIVMLVVVMVMMVMLVVIMMEMVMVMVGECSQPGRLAWLLFYVILKAIQEMSKNTRASQQ